MFRSSKPSKDDQPWDDGDECWHCAGCFLGRGNLETELDRRLDTFLEWKMRISASKNGDFTFMAMKALDISNPLGGGKTEMARKPLIMRRPTCVCAGKKDIWPTRDKRDSILKKETVAVIVAKLMVYFLNHSGWGIHVSTDWTGHASSN